MFIAPLGVSVRFCMPRADSSTMRPCRRFMQPYRDLDLRAIGPPADHSNQCRIEGQARTDVDRQCDAE
jgi:hypothetical protein